MQLTVFDVAKHSRWEAPNEIAWYKYSESRKTLQFLQRTIKFTRFAPLNQLKTTVNLVGLASATHHPLGCSCVQGPKLPHGSSVEKDCWSLEFLPLVKKIDVPLTCAVRARPGTSPCQGMCFILCLSSLTLHSRVLTHAGVPNPSCRDLFFVPTRQHDQRTSNCDCRGDVCPWRRAVTW